MVGTEDTLVDSSINLILIDHLKISDSNKYVKLEDKKQEVLQYCLVDCKILDMIGL